MLHTGPGRGPILESGKNPAFLRATGEADKKLSKTG